MTPTVFPVAVAAMPRGALNVMEGRLTACLATAEQIPPDPKTGEEMAGGLEIDGVTPVLNARSFVGRRFLLEGTLSLPCPVEERDSVVLFAGPTPLCLFALSDKARPVFGRVLITFDANGVFSL